MTKQPCHDYPAGPLLHTPLPFTEGQGPGFQAGLMQPPAGMRPLSAEENADFLRRIKTLIEEN